MPRLYPRPIKSKLKYEIMDQGGCSLDRNLKNVLRQLRETLEHISHENANFHGITSVLLIPGMIRDYKGPTSCNNSQRGPGKICRWISSNFLPSLGKQSIVSQGNYLQKYENNWSICVSRSQCFSYRVTKNMP